MPRTPSAQVPLPCTWVRCVACDVAGVAGVVTGGPVPVSGVFHFETGAFHICDRHALRDAEQEAFAQRALPCVYTLRDDLTVSETELAFDYLVLRGGSWPAFEPSHAPLDADIVASIRACVGEHGGNILTAAPLRYLECYVETLSSCHIPFAWRPQRQ